MPERHGAAASRPSFGNAQQLADDAVLPAAVAKLHSEEWSRLVASLARRFGDLDVAEEAAAEAFLAAVEHWRSELPANPGGWLMTTATRRAIDRLRREARRDAKYGAAVEAGLVNTSESPPQEQVMDQTAPGGPDDDRLRLMFTCCHPAIARQAQIALTLRLVGGLTVEQIARGLLKTEVAVSQRITRAKAKIAAARIPYRIPGAADIPERVDAVLTVLYLIYNEGYLPGGDEPVRPDLSCEALRLTRLVRELLPDLGEPSSLLALMLMAEARRPSRISADGELVPLAEQDRGAWDRRLIEEGHALVRGLIATGRPPGRYQLEAAISAVHTYARDIRETDWAQLDLLYERLYAVHPSPVVALNRAVVTAELNGAAAALAEVEALQLRDYHAWHATRADLLRRLGRITESRDAYDRAIALAVNGAELRYLRRRRRGLGG